MKAVVNLPLKNPDKVYKALMPDKDKAKRFDVKITKGKTNLKLEIKASDIAALKAALNSYLRLISIAEKVEEV